MLIMQGPAEGQGQGQAPSRRAASERAAAALLPGATSEAFADSLADFVRTDPEQALAGSAAAARGKVSSQQDSGIIFLGFRAARGKVSPVQC